MLTLGKTGVGKIKFTDFSETLNLAIETESLVFIKVNIIRKENSHFHISYLTLLIHNYIII